jgi:ketosteroid isomerase-like protein
VNLPPVVAEVTEAFERYEAALVARDLETMAESFADGAEVVRFGIADRQRGPQELMRWRSEQPALPPGRTLFETSVTTYGTDFAVVSTCFSYPGRPAVGRQSQTWLRGADGWKIVLAHVSEIDPAG